MSLARLYLFIKSPTIPLRFRRPTARIASQIRGLMSMRDCNPRRLSLLDIESTQVASRRKGVPALAFHRLGVILTGSTGRNDKMRITSVMTLTSLVVALSIGTAAHAEIAKLQSTGQSMTFTGQVQGVDVAQGVVVVRGPKPGGNPPR